MPAVESRRDAGIIVPLIAMLLAIGSTSCRREPQVHTVSIRAMQFVPAELIVEAGDVVVWKNDDFFPHTATARGAFDSASIPSGGSWRLETTTKGTFDYVCTLHPTMSGSLTIR
jgi:plastocyanin